MIFNFNSNNKILFYKNLSQIYKSRVESLAESLNHEANLGQNHWIMRRFDSWFDSRFDAKIHFDSWFDAMIRCKDSLWFMIRFTRKKVNRIDSPCMLVTTFDLIRMSASLKNPIFRRRYTLEGICNMRYISFFIQKINKKLF